MKDTIRCRSCELVQFRAARCRRCKRELFAPLSTREVVNVGALGSLATLPTVAEMELMLINEALWRTDGNMAEAAKMVGIGKTTIYRKLESGATDA